MVVFERVQKCVALPSSTCAALLTPGDQWDFALPDALDRTATERLLNAFNARAREVGQPAPPSSPPGPPPPTRHPPAPPQAQTSGTRPQESPLHQQTAAEFSPDYAALGTAVQAQTAAAAPLTAAALSELSAWLANPGTAARVEGVANRAAEGADAGVRALMGDAAEAELQEAYRAQEAAEKAYASMRQDAELAAKLQVRHIMLWSPTMLSWPFLL